MLKEMGSGMPRFDESLVRLGARFHSKDEAITAAIRILIDAGAVTPEYEQDVWERELTTSSYIGNHVAIPHGLDTTRKNIRTSALSLLQIPDGVSFGDEDAYLVIGIAGKEGEHLGLLSALAHILVDKSNVEALRTATSVAEINEILERVEK